MNIKKDNSAGFLAKAFKTIIARAQKGQPRSAKGLRTNFSIALWSCACFFVYFFLIFVYIYMNDISSQGNGALFFALTGGVLSALFGALYSAKLSQIVKLLTPSGRREKLSKELKSLEHRNKSKRRSR